VEPDTIKVLEAGKLRSAFALDPQRKVSSLAFSPDNKAIVARLEDDTIKVYDPSGSERMELSKGTLEVSSNSRFVAQWDGDAVIVWDTSRGEVLHKSLPPTGSSTRSLCFSPDSKEVAVGFSDGTAKLYYLETAEEFETEKMGDGDDSVRFSPDSKFLEMLPRRGRRLTGPEIDGQVTSKTWNVKARRLARKEELSIRDLEKPEPTLTVSSPASGKIASAQGESITLTGTSTEKMIMKKAHLGKVTALAFSPNGKTLASGGLDGTVRLWESNDLEHHYAIASLKKPNGSLNPVTSLTFSSDGKRLAMGTDTGDGTLVLWDLLSRQELLRLPERVPKSSTFSAGDKALGSHALGRIWLGAVESDRETVLPIKTGRKSDSPSWMSSRDEVAIPRNALIAGSSSIDKKFLHVCRLTYQNNVYVGDTSGSDCYIGNVGPRNGQFKFGVYEILVNADSALWRVNTEESSKHGSSTPRRLSAGTRAGEKPVGVCRVTNQSGTYIGWIADNECHIWNGSGVRGPVSGGLKFEILYENDTDGARKAGSRRRSR
jgi:WD40 repeat protein